MNQINSLKDVEKLIEDKIQESLILEYKREIDKDIPKDVSASANTLGGTIIYGIEEEEKNIPKKINWIDNKEGTKEKIENMIINGIDKRIQNLTINTILNDKDPSQAIFIVNIPESTDAPHMAKHSYYKRFNFQSVPMENKEVLDALFRKGLRESLYFELSKNLDLCDKTLKLIGDHYVFQSKDRVPIVFIPFYTYSWEAIINSGLLPILKENAEKLVETYCLISDINSIINYQTYHHSELVVNTPASEKYIQGGTYLPSILQDNIRRLKELLQNLNKNKNKKM